MIGHNSTYQPESIQFSDYQSNSNTAYHGQAKGDGDVQEWVVKITVSRARKVIDQQDMYSIYGQGKTGDKGENLSV